MCRIVGLISKSPSAIDMEELEIMRDTMRPGGPDAEGIWGEENGQVALAHRRLSILDLSEAGNQPMMSKSKRFVISYNGEVYNFQEIRSELESKGYAFDTNCDTEVVLAAFEEYGVKCAEQFHGMFAFAIWDRKLKKLTLARDRVGVKPLYYYDNDDVFIFASELKAITRYKKFEKKINKEALSFYFKYGYVPSPLAIFENCHKLESGHYLEFYSDGTHLIDSWWSPNTDKYDGFDWNDEALVEKETLRCLRASFKRRLVSDVDVGLFLSGGIDSGLLASVLSVEEGVKLNTFTVGFNDERFDEADAAQYISNKLGTRHHSTLIDTSKAKLLVPQIYNVWDEPFADTSTISTYLVCQFASQSVKVALSADGGDELFGGYPKYWLTIDRAQILEKLLKIKWFVESIPDSMLESFGRFGFGNKLLKSKEILLNSQHENLVLDSFINGQHIFTNYQLSLLYGSDIGQKYKFPQVDKIDWSAFSDDLSKMLYLDLLTYHTDDIHQKVDRASMAHSLEAREPFLDQDVIELSYNMPSKYKLRPEYQENSKYILRKLFQKYVENDYLNRPKKGFGVPLDKWLLDDLGYLIDEYLDKSKIKSQGLFDYDYVRKLIYAFRRRPQQELNKIWSLISFQMWYENWG